MFFNRKNKTEECRFYIPESKIEQVLIAYDNWMSAPSNAEALARYKFWKLIEDVIPQSKKTELTPFMKNGTKPYVVTCIK